MTYCYVCPHRCGVDRPENMNDTSYDKYFGSCGCGMLPIVARAGLHMWEEPCISGTKGSGTVFFSGCNLHCVFCQNFDISCKGFGKEISIERLQEIYQELIAQGAHNINLVTPTHFAEAVIKSLPEKLSVPVVYNTSGFESQDTLRKLNGKVQIYLPDLKYSDDKLAIKYSNAPYYFRIATDAIKEMHRQVGEAQFDENGMMKKGVIVRHLILPQATREAALVFDWVKNNASNCFFSLMSQYVPFGKAGEYNEINRKITKREYNKVLDFCYDTNFSEIYVQDLSSASKKFIPAFDLTGI